MPFLICFFSDDYGNNYEEGRASSSSGTELDLSSVASDSLVFDE